MQWVCTDPWWCCDTYCPNYYINISVGHTITPTYSPKLHSPFGIGVRDNMRTGEERKINSPVKTWDKLLFILTWVFAHPCLVVPCLILILLLFLALSHNQISPFALISATVLYLSVPYSLLLFFRYISKMLISLFDPSGSLHSFTSQDMHWACRRFKTFFTCLDREGQRDKVESFFFLGLKEDQKMNKPCA